MEDIKNFSDFLNNKIGVKPEIKTEDKKIEPVKENIQEVQPKVEEIVEEELIEEIQEEPVKEYKPSQSNNYIIYKDKSETFSCEIEVEGANISNTKVRLLVESSDWNLYFDGEINESGKVTIPLKKFSLFPEGSTGTIKMEVIADDTVFTPWEDNFEVKMSKKVSVKFNESKNSSAVNDDKPKIKFKR